MSFKNYNQEPFPAAITLLIQKCDAVILKIKESFASRECLIDKDLTEEYFEKYKIKNFIRK